MQGFGVNLVLESHWCRLGAPIRKHGQGFDLHPYTITVVLILNCTAQSLLPAPSELSLYDGFVADLRLCTAIGCMYQK